MDVRLFLAITLGALALALAVDPLRRHLRRRRRARLRNQPLTTDQERTLRRNVPIYRRLPAELQADLHANIQVFLDEKAFFGRGGLNVTDEMRITVAGNACMLLLNRAHDCFPGFRTILLYPGTFAVANEARDGDVVVRGISHHAGESWHRGPVILSWEDVLHSAKGGGDGFNVVIHEFAHKLDEANGWTDGNPVVGQAGFGDWSRVFSVAYEEFLQRIEEQPDAAIDDYGAVSAEEFFAVCTESFFEKPHLMKADWPELYGQLANFYAVDPEQW